MKKTEYNTIIIETARTGWVVKEKGRPTEIILRWDGLVRHIESRLTSKGEDNDR